MPIKYALFENNLTTDPNDHAAQVQITGSAGLEQIAELRVQQGSMTIRAEGPHP
ncbi:MAG: hypothetical protein H0W86_03075 [Armatimonadetes bacterium]|nr:hypothetical protein [Armatimonadota bacterium]